MTNVKIEAHGHLGDFKREYFIEEGKEWATTSKILREFYHYVRKAKEAQWDKLFRALDELAKIEKEALKKRGDVHE